jgi:hypothetical protein
VGEAEEGSGASARDGSPTHTPVQIAAAVDSTPPVLAKWWHSSPRQWLVTTVVAVLVSGLAAMPAWIDLFKTDVAPVISMPPALPSISGSLGQPVAAIDRRCGDSGDGTAGWGPDRPMVPSGGFLPWAGFNAHRWNSELGGDERNMVGGRETGSNQLWMNTVRVEDGKIYTLRIYIHNGADANDQADASDTRVRLPLPSCRAKRISINGFIRSTDAFPIEVWGGVNLVADRPFRITYVADSAKLEGNDRPEGSSSVPGTDFLGDEGQLVGQPNLDGIVRGGFENSMWFSILVKTSMD